MSAIPLRRARTGRQPSETVLEGSGLRLPDAAEVGLVGREAVLAPSEDIAVRPVDLPMPSRRQRLVAVGFAVEGEMADPLSESHVALGPEVARGRHLAAIVRHGRMAGWLRAIGSTDLARYRILPDALSLPRPSEGRWAIRASARRIVVRTPDGAGFAGRPGLVAKIWQAAERPKLVALAGTWPDGPELAEPVDGDLTAGHDAIAGRFDLRTGPYAAEIGTARIIARRAGWIAAAALAAQLGILALDARHLAAIHEARLEEARALLQQHAPQMARAGDPAAALVSLVPSGEQARSGRFLQLADLMSGTLSPDETGVALDKLTFSAADAVMTIAISAGDLAALQQIEQRFEATGLAPESGAATVRDGLAEAVITLTDPEGGAR